MDPGIIINPKDFRNNESLGIYIHIPFCQTKCFYCDFNTYTKIEDQIDEYISCVISEINIWGEILGKSSIRSIFFGGGTPSYIDSKYIKIILDSIHENFYVDKNIEVTLETNPNDVSKNKFIDLISIGINRISMGVQSFDDSLLRMLGRRHDSKEAESSYKTLRETGFDNLSIDLMYGLPYQSIQSWENTLDKSIYLKPNHISLYSLQVENGTPLKSKINSGAYEKPDDDKAAEMYEIAEKKLFNKNFFQYEISNWSKKSFECVHNKIYWENNFYLGIGAGAHSRINNFRFSNIKSPKKYINTLMNNKVLKSETMKIDFIENLDSLSFSDEISETMMMGMRLNQGIKLEKFKQKFGKTIYEIFDNEIKKLKNLNLIEINETHIRLSSKGRLLGNEVFQEFII
tara:strand:- start:2029 stop:3234 length:1206 start_codon:yes stop_codon:yes gene_type:complete